MRTFVLPDLGEGLHEAEVVEWHVAEGDAVEADQPLVSVETDKAVTEIPSPWRGRVTRLFAATGETIKVGAPVAEFEDDAAEAAAAAAAEPDRPEPEIAADRPEPADSPPAAAGRPAAVKAMPAVRALARELGVDLGAIRGTGPDGFILARDLAQAIRAGAPEPDGYEPLTGPRRAMAEHMTRAHAEITPTTLQDEADVSAWAPRGGMTVRLLRAVCIAAAAEPALNAWYDRERGRLLHKAVHVGIAVDAPDSLYVPVMRDAGTLGPAEMAAALERLVEAARRRRLGRDEMTGATITLTNFGPIGGRWATPVVMPPQ